MKESMKMKGNMVIGSCCPNCGRDLDEVIHKLWDHNKNRPKAQEDIKNGRKFFAPFGALQDCECGKPVFFQLYGDAEGFCSYLFSEEEDMKEFGNNLSKVVGISSKAMHELNKEMFGLPEGAGVLLTDKDKEPSEEFKKNQRNHYKEKSKKVLESMGFNVIPEFPICPYCQAPSDIDEEMSDVMTHYATKQYKAEGFWQTYKIHFLTMDNFKCEKCGNHYFTALQIQRSDNKECESYWSWTQSFKTKAEFEKWEVEEFGEIPIKVPDKRSLKQIIEDDGKPIAPITIVNGNKIGRNELCPCGSGKKYKKCCLGKTMPQATA